MSSEDKETPTAVEELWEIITATLAVSHQPWCDKRRGDICDCGGENRNKEARQALATLRDAYSALGHLLTDAENERDMAEAHNKELREEVERLTAEAALSHDKFCQCPACKQNRKVVLQAALQPEEEAGG